jgi:hypothetical protein
VVEIHVQPNVRRQRRFTAAAPSGRSRAQAERPRPFRATEPAHQSLGVGRWLTAEVSRKHVTAAFVDRERLAAFTSCQMSADQAAINSLSQGFNLQSQLEKRDRLRVTFGC